jgi:dihydrolipoamide dehydrogenase
LHRAAGDLSKVNRPQGLNALAAALSLALEMGARLENVALTIHAHPTASEAFHESALAALGHPLHI